MPIFNHNGQFGQAIGITHFVRNAQNSVALGDPLPLLSGGGTNLAAGQAALHHIGPAHQITRAYRLFTCACVIYTSTHPAAVTGAWVHHANTGHVGVSDVKAAIARLGNPPAASIIVIFAHPKDHDNGYVKSVATIVSSGILANNVVVVPKLLLPQFGINNLGFIGC